MNESFFGSFAVAQLIFSIICGFISLAILGVFVFVIIRIVTKQNRAKNNEQVNQQTENNDQTITTKVNIGGVGFSFTQTTNNGEEKEVVCKYCGAKNSSKSTTCGNCGAVL